MEITKIVLGDSRMSSNCYVLHKDNKAIVIDPGFEDNALYNFLSNKELVLDKIILTHGHFDHWGGLKKLRLLYPNTLLYASSLDYIWYEVGVNNRLGYEPKIDVDLSKLKEIDLLGDNFKIMTLPGHSLGSIGLYNKNKLFSGDVLFFGSIGRTDLPQGDFDTLISSIKKIYSLPNDTIVYNGHGRPTTVLNEKQSNPFIRG